MKKLFLSSLIVTSVFAFAYTQIDVDNATYLAGKGIITTQSTTAGYRLKDTITRAEMMGIALKIKGITLPNYQCKGYFTDTRDNNWICRAVELAADNGIITKTNTKARPQDSITRAEALAIVMKASGNEVGMGGYAGYKYYFDANLYTEGGIGFRNAYTFGATWQAETFYQYIRTILEDDSLLKQNPRASTPATRAEVFGFAKNILSLEGSSPKEVRIENNNVVVYENGKKVKVLTQDGNSTIITTCMVPDEYNNYFLDGRAGDFFIISHSVGLCETDAGHTDFLIFDGTSLVNLVTKIKQKFDIQLGYGMGASIAVKNNQIRIFGEFSYSADCDGLGCPIYLTSEKIKSLGIKVISTPTQDIPGTFEFLFNPSILF